MRTITIASELAIVDFDPEMADMSNPNGQIIGEVWFFMCTDDKGNRKRSSEIYNCIETIKRVAIQKVDDSWYDMDPEYGSEAYEEWSMALPAHGEYNDE